MTRKVKVFTLLGQSNMVGAGKAQVYMDVGEAMGKAMVELLGKSAK